MSALKELRSELRSLRKTHCPPVSKLKKADIKKEIDRLKEHKPTEVVVPESKPRMKKAKKETREMEVQADMEQEEKESMADRMARLRAMRKVGSVLKKNVEQKKEKAKKEEAAKKITSAVRKVAESKKVEKKEKKEREMMGEEDTLSSKKRAFEKMMKEKEEEELPPLESAEAPIRPANKRKLRTGGEVIAKVNKIEEKVEEKVEEEAPVTKKKEKKEKGTDEFDGKYLELMAHASFPSVYKAILKEKGKGIYDLELMGQFFAAQGQHYFQKAKRKSSIKDVKLFKRMTAAGEKIFAVDKAGNNIRQQPQKVLSEKEVEKVEKK
jgi:hypothetical protein